MKTNINSLDPGNKEAKDDVILENDCECKAAWPPVNMITVCQVCPMHGHSGVPRLSRQAQHWAGTLDSRHSLQQVDLARMEVPYPSPQEGGMEALYPSPQEVGRKGTMRLRAGSAPGSLRDLEDIQRFT